MSSLTFRAHSGSGPLHSCWFWTNLGLGPPHGSWGLRGPLGIGQIEVNAFCCFREIILAGSVDTKGAEVPRREENDGEEIGPKVGREEEVEERWEEELEEGPNVGQEEELGKGREEELEEGREEEVEERPKVGWAEELGEGQEEELEERREEEVKEGTEVGREAELREEQPDLLGQALREVGAGTLRRASCGLMGRASMTISFLTMHWAIWEHNIKPVCSLI